MCFHLNFLNGQKIVSIPEKACFRFSCFDCEIRYRFFDSEHRFFFQPSNFFFRACFLFINIWKIRSFVGDVMKNSETWKNEKRNQMLRKHERSINGRNSWGSFNEDLVRSNT